MEERDKEQAAKVAEQQPAALPAAE
jgi:hypothetical protein